MSTRNNKGEYNTKIEQPITPETRKEIINKLVEEQAAVVDEKEEKFLESSVEEIEAQPVNEVEDPCTCDETCVCDEQECTDPACACEKPSEERQNLPSPEVLAEIDAEMNAPKGPEHYEKISKSFEKEPKEVHFKFQDEYHFGPGNGDAVIDTLSEPVKAPERKKKTFEQMSACEMNIYHKTGIIPFC
jgi:hypothetical protein